MDFIWTVHVKIIYLRIETVILRKESCAKLLAETDL